jgi:hypothetical protein
MNLAAMIKLLITRRKDASEPENTPLDFVKSKKGIMKELVISQHSGKLIGVYAAALGKGMFLTGVENIEYEGKAAIVVFDQYDASGHILSITRVPVNEIRMVCPFNKIAKKTPVRLVIHSDSITL